MAVNGSMKRLCKEEEVGYVFAEGLSGAVASGLGKVRYLNWMGRGVCQRRLKKYKRIADTREYRETHPKQKLNACA